MKANVKLFIFLSQTITAFAQIPPRPNGVSCVMESSNLLEAVSNVASAAACGQLCLEKPTCQFYTSYVNVSSGLLQGKCLLFTTCNRINYICPGCHLGVRGGEETGNTCSPADRDFGGKYYCRNPLSQSEPVIVQSGDIGNFEKCVYRCGDTVKSIECRFGSLYDEQDPFTPLPPLAFNCPCSQGCQPSVENCITDRAANVKKISQNDLWSEDGVVCDEGLVYSGGVNATMTADEGEVQGGTVCTRACGYSLTIMGECNGGESVCMDSSWSSSLEGECEGSTPLWYTLLIVGATAIPLTYIIVLLSLCLFYRHQKKLL